MWWNQNLAKLQKFSKYYDHTIVVAKKELYGQKKRKEKIGMLMVIIESFYLIGYLDEVIRPSSYKTSGYVKTFKVKDEDKDNKNKLMSFRNKIEDLKI